MTDTKQPVVWELSEYRENLYPKHCRTSCSDEHPNNADIDGTGCHRCNAIFFTKAEANEARITELEDRLNQQTQISFDHSLAFDAAKERITELEAENHALKGKLKAIRADKMTGLRKLEGRNKEGLYYLQDSRQYVGNCPLWWRTGGGYTTALDEAAVFTLENAARQMRTRSTDVPWPCFEMDALRRPTVDCQYMPRTPANQIEAIAQEGGK